MTNIVIKGTELNVQELEGIRVISAYDVARLHQREVREVNQQFERNKYKLILSEDYFIVKREHFSESQMVIQSFIPNNVKE